MAVARRDREGDTHGPKRNDPQVQAGGLLGGQRRQRLAFDPLTLPTQREINMKHSKAELRAMARAAIAEVKPTIVPAHKPRQSRVLATVTLDGNTHSVRNPKVHRTYGNGTRRGEILSGCYTPAGQQTLVRR